jgi:hypothetical protein
VLTVQELNWCLMDLISGETARTRFCLQDLCLTGIIHGVLPVPEHLPDDPALLKQMLLESYEARTPKQEVKDDYATHFFDL